MFKGVIASNIQTDNHPAAASIKLYKCTLSGVCVAVALQRTHVTPSHSVLGMDDSCTESHVV